MVQSIAHADTRAFRKVVLIEFPRRGMLAIGFVTGEARGEVQENTFEDVLNVFVPTMPNPTSGFPLCTAQQVSEWGNPPRNFLSARHCRYSWGD